MKIHIHFRIQLDKDIQHNMDFNVIVNYVNTKNKIIKNMIIQKNIFKTLKIIN